MSVGHYHLYVLYMNKTQRFAGGSLVVAAVSLGVVAAPAISGTEPAANAAPQSWFNSTKQLGYSYGLHSPRSAGPEQLTMRTRKGCLVYLSRVPAPQGGKKTIVTIQGRNGVPGRFDNAPTRREFQSVARRLGCA